MNLSGIIRTGTEPARSTWRMGENSSRLEFGFVAYVTDEVQEKEWGITSQRLGFSGNGIRYRYQKGRYGE
jgi:hypothetical protein